MIPATNRTLVVGLTGGIGSGKSAVSRLLGRFGIPVIDADVLARQVTDSDENVRIEIRKEFGPSIFDENGHLLRSRLGELVFKNEKARHRLNAIIHPRVLQIIDSEVATYAEHDSPVVIVDAALIYEAEIEDRFDAVIVVFAPLDARLKRLRRRDNMKDDDILARIQSQIPLERKAQKADYVVDNNGSLFALRKKVRALIRWLEAKRRGVPRDSTSAV